MVSAKVSALVGAIAAASSVSAFGKSDNMGPAAIMWPSDRPWTKGSDSTGPCGSSDSSVGERTPFPIQNGKLSLVTQDSVRAVHLSVSYKSNPTKLDDFETFFGPEEVGTLGTGHTCLTTPDLSGVKNGDVGTFSMMYAYGDKGETSYHYACADVTFMDVPEFLATDVKIQCFNTTLEDPEISVDNTVPVTTTDENGNNPHIDELTANEKASANSGPNAGTIAGAVVGAVAGVSLIGAVAFFWRRRAAQKKREEEQMREVNEKGDAASTRS